ncbi:PAAR motif-containing protein [Paraburkholderia unamae]|uniref:PAAR domain-containing protein n=1 Tax=Paraburkholderia unamae TaxID=219649 RepID=UPI001CAC69A6|nr:PAAR domain-containing protein [Paraburkholderia unamae]CAG9265139.1 PAAR motif-containing protein [Paraburkholderia unamae]
MSEKTENKGKFYSFVTVGALTERGGRVTSGGGGKICGLPIARVGSVVTYRDASEAVIIDGAGYAAVMEDQPMALIGSRLSNGDKIIGTPWEDVQYGIFIKEGETIPGLFDPDWTPPPREPVARFAVRGATTARGGVLRDATSDWDVDDTQRKAGKVGDFVDYSDGSRARIITGLGIPDNELHRYAVVGSRLDNGDVIADSPHRDPRTSTSFVPVDVNGAAITRA